MSERVSDMDWIVLKGRTNGNRMFRDLVRSHLVRSLPPIGPFATRYFSHLFAPYRP